MTRFTNAVLTLSVAGLAAISSPAGAGAHGSTAGSTVRSVACVPKDGLPCPSARTAFRGGEFKVRGRRLRDVRAVVFRGRRGRNEAVVVRARHTGPTHAEVTVPARAHSGRLELRFGHGRRVLAPAVRVRRVAAAPQPIPSGTPPLASSGFVFPIRGPHDLGQSATNNFGGSRNHAGQDMFAACGTPLAAVEGGTVRTAETAGAGGNQLVITGTQTGRDYAYLHMRDRALVAEGEQVAPGQPVGYVGESGNASGCHLHFEIWSSPGRYVGGTAIDPLPDLKTLDAQDPPHDH